MRILFFLALGVMQILTVGTSSADIQPEPSEMEVSLLPEYCKHAPLFRDKYGSMEEYQRWRDRLGPAFEALHHYCWALVAIQRTNKVGVTKQWSDFWLSTSIAEIDYVLRHSDKSFILLPELLTRRGVSLMKLRNFSAADESFRRAIELKLDYWPAHLGLAQSSVARGDKAGARKLLEESIPKVSDDRMLKRMLADLQRAQ